MSVEAVLSSAVPAPPCPSAEGVCGPGGRGGAARQTCSLWLLQVDEQVRACYEQTMAEWLGCEAIVRQREKESHAAALAKCSSGASLDSHIQKMMHRDSTISNEVRPEEPQCRLPELLGCSP